MSDEDFKQIAKRAVGKMKNTIQEEREEHVQTTIKKLKERHGATYTPMQIRIWSEMVAGNLHSSLDEAQKSSTFARAGGE